MEIHILDMIQNLRTPIGDVVVPLITRLGDAGIIWIILTVLLLIIPKTRKTGVIMMAALLVDVLLCNVLIKNLVARTRPFDVNTAVQLLVAKPQDYSFPSGHTAASFASVTALYLAGEKKMWKAALVLAVLIALSRLYLYVHYPTDIIGGVVFGSLSGYLGYKIVEWIQKKKDKIEIEKRAGQAALCCLPCSFTDYQCDNRRSQRQKVTGFHSCGIRVVSVPE